MDECLDRTHIYHFFTGMRPHIDWYKQKLKGNATNLRQSDIGLKFFKVYYNF